MNHNWKPQQKLQPIQINEAETAKLAKFATQILQIEFNNLAYLKEALIHRSYINEMRNNALRHNERLEFLGDAVLELITTEYLFHQYPDRPEGELTSFRAALVRTESLAAAALELNLGDYIFMSKGEEGTGGRRRPYILANTFEAVLGAIYLDLGWDACAYYVDRILIPKLERIVLERLDIDAKSKLQERAQELLKITPSYQLVEEIGPDHDKNFTMAVMINGQEFGRGTGHSKQEAEQKAAQAAIQNWQSLYEKYTKSDKITPVS
jgi:ribonuclease-3